MENTSRMQELVEKLNEASASYYGGGEEIISNFEWDAMFDELAKLEKETGIVLENSPTVSVSYSENISSDREAHEFPALSLAKTKSVEELKAFAGNREVNLSYKQDGLSLVISYDNGRLTRILTRGDGTYGNNITFLADSLIGVPKTIDYKGHLVVRGEAVITYSDFDMINSLIEDEDEQFANPRNLASGTLALDDPMKVKERMVRFVAFTLVYLDENIKSWKERMDFLKQNGFMVVEYLSGSAETMEEMVDTLTARVEDGSFDIPVDGLVLVYDDTEYASSGSVTGHHATRAGLAFKWADVSAFTTLKYVEWSCASSTISPVAVFEPVMLEGTTVSRASLCNISEMERLGIGEGCTLEIIKANKIIPKCISVKDSTKQFEIPSKCPVCDAPARINISSKSLTKTLHCTNPDCIAKQGKKFERFVSKSALDIDGLSLQTMLKFMNAHFITDFADIFHLNAHSGEIMGMEGFGKKSVENMLKAIEDCRKVKAVNFIFALSIPQIGLDAAKKIISALGFEDFHSRLKLKLDFLDVDGIGNERSDSILEWYSNEKNAEVFEKLLSEVTLLETEKKTSKEGTCVGLTFVITGDVHSFKNRDEFKAYVEANGGKVAGSVSGKTDFLVNNDIESASSKNKKAKELSVPIITEDDFIEKFGK